MTSEVVPFVKLKWTETPRNCCIVHSFRPKGQLLRRNALEPLMVLMLGKLWS